jgi:hypothetical protein
MIEINTTTHKGGGRTDKYHMMLVKAGGDEQIYI